LKHFFLNAHQILRITFSINLEERLSLRIVSLHQIHRLGHHLISALDCERNFESIGSTYLKSDEKFAPSLPFAVSSDESTKRSLRDGAQAPRDDDPSKSMAKNIRRNVILIARRVLREYQWVGRGGVVGARRSALFLRTCDVRTPRRAKRPFTKKVTALSFPSRRSNRRVASRRVVVERLVLTRNVTRWTSRGYGGCQKDASSSTHRSPYVTVRFPAICANAPRRCRGRCAPRASRAFYPQWTLRNASRLVSTYLLSGARPASPFAPSRRFGNDPRAFVSRARIVGSCDVTYRPFNRARVSRNLRARIMPLACLECRICRRFARAAIGRRLDSRCASRGVDVKLATIGRHLAGRRSGTTRERRDTFKY